jgi:polyhydroxyalkanoate synthase
MREMSIGGQLPDGSKGGPVGLMPARDLAASFSFLRPNDLVWNYVVSNYLKGEAPPPFDLLYWNADSTNLPGPFFAWYLRNTYLEDRLKKRGACKVAGVPIDLSRISMPTYVYGSREDHIVPWQSAYASTQLLSGPTRFVLGASGHIAGVINPPEKGRRNYWAAAASSTRLPKDPKQWFAGAREIPGSWWPDWDAWLARFGGKKISAPRAPGAAKYPAIENAPGRYVRVRAT